MKESINSSTSCGDEAAWEIRPSGMLVQKRENDAAANPTIIIKVSYASQEFDLPVPPELTFGNILPSFSDFQQIFWLYFVVERIGIVQFGVDSV